MSHLHTVYRRLLVCLLCFSMPHLRAAEATKSFDVPAGDAIATLKAAAKQGGVEIMFPADSVQGIRTNAVKGEFVPREALKRMVANTGLIVVQDEKTGALAVEHLNPPEKNVQGAAPEAAASVRPADEEMSRQDEGKVVELGEYIVRDTKPFLGSNIDLPRTKDDVQPYYFWGSTEIQNSGATDIQDFFQRMVPMDTNRASSSQNSTISYSPSNISLNGLSGNSGVTSGTQNTLILVNGVPQPSFSYIGATYQTDLNGIPLDAIDHIEVLPASASAIYGASAAGGVVNVILKHDYAGAQLSATYDNTFRSDAPTRKISLNIGETLEGGKTHVMLSASYQFEKPLLVQDRLDIIDPYRALYYGLYPGGQLGALGVTTGSAFLAQPMIRSVNGSSLFAGSAATVVQVPVGYQGGQVSGLAPLQANIGNYNLSHPNNAFPSAVAGRLAPLFLGPTEKGFELLVRRQMTPWLEAHVQIGNTEDLLNSTFSNTLFSSINIAANAPGNPFGQAVYVSGIENAHLPWGSDTISRTISAGAKISLPHDWIADFDYAWGSSSFESAMGSVDSTAMQAAANNGTLNLIADLSLYPFNATNYSYTTSYVGYASTDALQLKAAGPLMDLWAGAPSLAIGVEHQTSGAGNDFVYNVYPARLTTPGVAATSTASSVSYYPGANTSDGSGYAELTVPLVRESNRIFGVKQLDFNAAGRFDDIKSFLVSPNAETITNLVNGSTSSQTTFVPQASKYQSYNGTFGLKYKPMEDIFFRASYSMAFVPPTYTELRGPVSTSTNTNPTPYPGVPTTSPWRYVSITDPLLNATYYAPQMTGGNPGLNPETSRGADWGIVFEPHFIKGFRISVDYTKVTKYNDIIAPPVQTLINLASQFPGRVVRGTPNAGQTVGPIVLINDTYLNAPIAITSAYNVAADYTLRTASLGEWKLSALANSWQHYEIQSTLQGALVEQLGNPDVSPISGGLGSGSGLAKFKGNLGLDWAKGPWSAGWLVRYVGPYTDGSYYGLGGGAPYYTATVNGWISGQVYHDVYAGYRLGKAARGSPWWRRAFADTSVHLGVKNIFSHIPPYDAYTLPTYASPYGDLKLADYYLTVKKSW